MATKQFDKATLRKLQSNRPVGPRQPENGAVAPSEDEIREAVREANDPNRLVSIKPGFYGGR